MYIFLYRLFGTIENKIRNRGDEGVEKLIKFVPFMGKKTVFSSVRRSKTIERGETRGGMAADNGSARSDKKRELR